MSGVCEHCFSRGNLHAEGCPHYEDETTSRVDELEDIINFSESKLKEAKNLIDEALKALKDV